VQRFTDIRVWQQAHKLTLGVYRRTRSFPKEEVYGVTSQLRRAAASIGANIAEGSKKRTNKDYARFLNTAEGSLAETEYFLILSRDLGYLKTEDAEPLINECNDLAKRLGALRSKVEASA
jgi:four helix bundle protein